jgi:hypothetical protein
MAGDEDCVAENEDQPDDGDMSEAEIDYNLMETFPASDPPSWTLGISPHKKSRRHFEAEPSSASDPSHQNEPDAPAE